MSGSAIAIARLYTGNRVPIYGGISEIMKTVIAKSIGPWQDPTSPPPTADR